MTRREELIAMSAKLEALANDGPRNISFGAAQNLANAARSITDAIQYAVDAKELEELKRRAKGQ